MSEYGVVMRIGSNGQPFYVVLENGRTSLTFSASEFADFAEQQFNKAEEDIANIEAIHDAALQEQSQALALARQNADAAAELLKRDDATIRELQERNARLLDMVNTKELEKVELRKTIAQREELLRVQGDTCERYKQFVSDMRPLFTNLVDVKCIYFGFGDAPSPIITPLRPDKMLECWQEIQETQESASTESEERE